MCVSLCGWAVRHTHAVMAVGDRRQVSEWWVGGTASKRQRRRRERRKNEASCLLKAVAHSMIELRDPRNVRCRIGMIWVIWVKRGVGAPLTREEESSWTQNARDLVQQLHVIV